jgi:hypothetical protein
VAGMAGVVEEENGNGKKNPRCMPGIKKNILF